MTRLNWTILILLAGLLAAVIVCLYGLGTDWLLGAVVALPCNHLPVKVLPFAYWFRHGGTHPMSDELTAYTYCTHCGEILSLDNEAARLISNGSYGPQ